MSWKASGETFLRHLRYDRLARATLLWLLRRSGPMATSVCYTMHCAPTQPGLSRPDVQFVANELPRFIDPWFPPFTARPAETIGQMVMGLHPRSRGWLKLASADAQDAPRLRFNLLTDNADVQTLIRAVRMCRDTYAAKPQADLIAGELEPGANVPSDAELTQSLRETMIAAIHHVGACRMGADAASVVDADLRVRGVDGLRVADASIIPEVPGGNTNIPVVMIGELAADIIRGPRLPRVDVPDT